MTVCFVFLFNCTMSNLLTFLFFYSFFFFTLVLPQLCVMSSLVIWAQRPLPASLVWPAQDGGTVRGWLFPALPSLFSQAWGSSWKRSQASTKVLAAR